MDFIGKFRIETILNEEEQKAYIDLHRDLQGLSNRISRQVLDLKEQAIREALIKLGWTPPN